MRLKTLLYSQRDDKWGNLILGFNTNPKYNIANYGCLITCFADYLGNTPAEINDILKTNNGFTAGGGDFVWAKCVALGLKETYVSPSYTGPVTSQGITKIKECLDNGLPLVCEIDFNPATTAEEMHFVLLCGYNEDKILAADPWTGQVIDLDVYGGPQRAIIQFRAYDKKLTKDIAEGVPDDEKKALELLKAIPHDNLEGLVRQLTGEHQNYASLESKAKQFDGFVAKWVSTFDLPTTSGLMEIEIEMSKLSPLEDRVNKFREAIEGIVGSFTDDSALLVALQAVKMDKDKLVANLAECQLKLSTKRASYVFDFGNYTIKIYKRG